MTYKYAYSFDANGYVKELKSLEKKGALADSKQLMFIIPTKSRF
ncbi:hypothetical protein [Dyadobacter chenwenxiniae]|nr:hypothetical protein [Dyadobacter chenwenxiniae]